MNRNHKIVITTGDPNGIGAEVTIKALRELKLPQKTFAVISNEKILKHYGLKDIDFELINIDYDEADIQEGKITAQSGKFSFECLKKACEMAKLKQISAIVTAPVAKEAMHLAGYNYNGQTEVLQHFLAHDEQHAEMLFVVKDFRVLLLTRHVAIKDITMEKDDLYKIIKDTDKFFKKNLKIKSPKFALCGLNPHAGEGGILGSEEKDIFMPLVDELREHGVNITNPMPADTLFVKGVYNYLQNNKMPYDCYLACYHDQGLIPIKTVGGNNTVNMTIGLDVLRTSPCHGTAFDIAGQNKANHASMVSAIKCVIDK